MHPYPVPTMVELSVLGWAGFILIPLSCEAAVMILIFRIPWRWAIEAILLASVVNWCVCLLGLHGLWLFADKFVGLIYFVVGTPLKALVVSGFFAFQNIKSHTKNRITRDVLRSIGWAITTGVISWFATLYYLSFLDSHYTLWR
jgi:hypothetical protein